MIYKKNKLTIDGFKVDFLAKKFSTPIYCYSLKKIKKNILDLKHHFKKINPLICYAVKANTNINYGSCFRNSAFKCTKLI